MNYPGLQCMLLHLSFLARTKLQFQIISNHDEKDDNQCLKMYEEDDEKRKMLLDSERENSQSPGIIDQNQPETKRKKKKKSQAKARLGDNLPSRDFSQAERLSILDQ